jgi:hypothetical protein
MAEDNKKSIVAEIPREEEGSRRKSLTVQRG